MKARQWLTGMLALIMCLMLAAPGASAASKTITIDLDGQTLESDVPPYLTAKNVTMVPAGVISKGLGASVSWDQGAKTATITQNGTVLKLKSGAGNAQVDGKNVALDSSVQVRQGRVMVPIRFVSENLGLQVVWNQAAQHISLNRAAVGPEVPVPDQPSVPSVPAPTVPAPTAPSVPSVPAPGQTAAKPMKGVWISTVYNLDWPSTGSAGNAAKQKAEFDSLLDKLKAIGFNAVFVQVRPSGDSLYPSRIVPWSKVLTGTQGKDPGYDPLAYMVDAAHKRGMQFHAWFNPFRATLDGKTTGLAANHVAVAHPEWTVNAGGKLYLNPGVPAARQHIIDTVMEVVNGYDVDGVHLDDYFYPSNVTFADDNAFRTYNPSGIASKADWRRDNINRFVKDLGEAVHTAKPKVSYGISPFGVWRNVKTDSTGSDTAAGVTAYDSMFADTRTWISEQWIDYIAPQVYWSLSFSQARYDKLVDWWVNEVKDSGVKLYIGQGAYKVGDVKQSAEWQSGEQIINQLKYNEKYPEVEGSIMFRAADLTVRNPGNLAGLLTFYYKQ